MIWLYIALYVVCAPFVIKMSNRIMRRVSPYEDRMISVENDSIWFVLVGFLIWPVVLILCLFALIINRIADFGDSFRNSDTGQKIIKKIDDLIS